VALITAALGWISMGREIALGAAPVRAAVVHGILLTLLWPLIHWFPWKRHAAAVVLLLALAARAAMLPMLPSDDVHRYVWEGRVLAAGANPYLLAPDAPELAGLRDDHWDRINHKDMTAIYPPGMLLLFRVLTWITETPRGFKYAISLVDLLAVGGLLLLLRAVGRRPAWALLYALNPVILAGHAGEAHLDAFFVLCTVAMLLAWARRRWTAMLLAIALAVQVKYIAILFLPFALTRENWRCAWVFVGASVLCLLPFWPGTGLFTSLGTFSRAMHYNGSLHALLGWLLGDYPLAATVSAALLACALLAIRAATPRLLEGGLLAMAALVLCAPNVHFWYLAWFVPFLCLVPFPPLVLLCGTIAFTYFTLGHAHATGVWRELPWVPWLVYVPVYAAFLLTALRPRRPRPLADDLPGRAPGPLSVVIPVLNEAERIEGALENLAAQGPAVGEVIVADAGSTDRTATLAAAAGGRVLQTPPGRGIQIAAGVQAARGNAVAVLHVDARLEPGALARVMESLKTSGRAGGCVGGRFTGRDPFLRGIDVLNAARARFFGIAFGDQCQFFLKDRLEEAGGFPRLPIMEDVELSLRLRELGPPLYLGHGVRSEPRRWSSTGKLGHAFLVVRLVAAYGLRRILRGRNADTRDFYRAYYGARTERDQGEGADVP
jgi:rSAM/selenodomain-associated transferase 2